MTEPDLAENRALIEAFERCETPASSFHHAEHVRLGWAYLCESELLEALARFRAALMRFAVHNGVPNLYNETITFAFLLLINDRRARRPDASWSDFAASNPDLLQWKPSILERYYDQATLRTKLARTTFLFPERS